MAVYTELLPERKASRRSGIRWTPATDNDFSPVAGFLLIDTDRARVSYTVAEFPCQFPGRAFHLAKVGEGTDPTEPSYAVFCSHHGPAGDSCDCKGHTRFGHCKHGDALRALLANGWI